MGSTYAVRRPYRSVLASTSQTLVARPTSASPKMAMIASAVGLVLLVLFIHNCLTHIGTYDVLLTTNVGNLSGATSKPADTHPAITVNASARLVRIDQTSREQYSSDTEHTIWSPSACSAATMTMIANAILGTNYHISDILAIEAGFTSPEVITSDSGLLYHEGVDRTMGYFGLVTHHEQYSVDQLIATANSGTPVLVNFPPPTWPGGHFLVVIGGNKQYVHLADSSQLNMQWMARERFQHYWRGFADTFTPTQYSVMGKPTVSVAFIDQVLSYYHSPAAGQGQALYELGKKYRIDPAFALVFFGHESTFGTQGVARESLSLGNLRCIGKGFEDLSPTCQNGYAYFRNWRDGSEAFYRLMAGSLYNASGLVTPDQIIPRYAPQSDHNNEVGYIAALKKSIDRARSGHVDIENYS